jgi:hypothetical protein
MAVRNKRVLIYEEKDSNPRGDQWTTRYFLLLLADGSIRLSKSRTGWSEGIFGYYHNGDQLFEAVKKALKTEDIPVWWLDRKVVLRVLKGMSRDIARQFEEAWGHFDEQEETRCRLEDEKVAQILQAGKAGAIATGEVIERFLLRFRDDPRRKGAEEFPSVRQQVAQRLREIIEETGTLPRSGFQIVENVWVDIPWLREQLLSTASGLRARG